MEVGHKHVVDGHVKPGLGVQAGVVRGGGMCQSKLPRGLGWMFQVGICSARYHQIIQIVDGRV